jgi:hypothetical protein
MNTIQDVIDKLTESASNNAEMTENTKESKEHLLEIKSKQLPALTTSQNAMTSAVDSFIKGIENNRLFDVENRREDVKREEELIGAVKKIGKDSKSVEKTSSSFDFGHWLPNLLGSIVGPSIGIIVATGTAAVIAAYENMKTTIKGLIKVLDLFKDALVSAGKFVIKPIDLITKPIQEAFNKSWAKVTEVIDNIKLNFESTRVSIARVFEEFGTSLKAKFTSLFASFKIPGLETIRNAITAITVAVSETIDSFRSAFARFADFFKGSGGDNKIFSIVGSTFDTIKDFIKGFGNWIDSIVKLVTPLTAFLKRVFVPLGWILAIKDTWEAAIQGYEREGIVGGIKDGIKGFLGSIMFGLFDFIKDGVSWLMSLVGLDQLAQELDKFSFTELGNRILDTIYDFFGKAVDNLTALFTGKVDIGAKISEFGDMAAEFMKKVLRAVLPDPSADLWSVSGMTAAAIPDSIYEYAGLDPKTGKELKKPTEVKAARENTLSGVMSDIVVRESPEMAKGPQLPPIIVAPSNQSNTQNNVNNSSANTVINGTFGLGDDSHLYNLMP